MAIFEIISFDGYIFSAGNIHPGLPWSGARGQWTVNPRFLPRANMPGLLAGAEVSPRVIPADLIYTGTDPDVIGAIDTLLGQLQPDNTEARVLVMSRNGVLVQNYAVVQLAEQSEDSPTSLPVRFICARPTWEKLTPTTYGPLTWSGTAPAPPAVLAVPNAGKARANLNLTLKPTALDASVDVLSVRKTFTVTNNGDTTLRKFPRLIDLGNTSAWSVTSAARLWVFQDGVVVPREAIAIKETQSYLWILVDELAPGATFTYELAWDGPSDLGDLTGVNRPAFDISWEKGTATSGSTTTVVKTGAGWRTNQWRRGEVFILSGTGALQKRKIASSTSDTITIEGSNFSPAPAAASVFLLTMSDNERWIYDVAQVERNNSNRGLWYQNRGQTNPSSVLFDTPGSWHRILVLDNNDEKTNTRWYNVDVGGGDIDYFNGLNTVRTAQGWASPPESGQADGVAFSSPIEIDGFRFDYAFKNMNGICKAVFGARESGAEDWESIHERTTASDTLTAYATPIDIAFTDDMRHLMAVTLPINDEEVPVSWKRETGSRTGGGASTLTDDTKVWATNQWANGKVRIIAGTGVGQVRTVISNSTATLTISSGATDWDPIPSGDSRFEVINKQLEARLWHHTLWEVRLNTSKITNSALSSDIFPSYSLKHNLQLAGGPDLVAPYQDIRIGMDDRYIHLAGTEELRIDGGARRAAIHTTATGAKVKDVSSAVLVRTKETDGNFYLSPEWLLVQPAPATPAELTNVDFPSNITGWSLAGFSTGLATRTVTWDGTMGHLANGSFKIEVTASTAGIGAIIWYTHPASGTNGPPVVPGRSYTVTAWGRSDLRNWVPKIGISWYDAGGSNIGNVSAGSVAVDYVHTVDTWLEIGVTAVAPANAAFGKPAIIAYVRVASSLDTVWFDEIRWDTTALFFAAQSTGISATVTPSLTEGFYS